jgi:hypothetical protein
LIEYITEINFVRELLIKVETSDTEMDSDFWEPLGHGDEDEDDDFWG